MVGPAEVGLLGGDEQVVGRLGAVAGLAPVVREDHCVGGRIACRILDETRDDRVSLTTYGLRQSGIGDLADQPVLEASSWSPAIREVGLRRSMSRRSSDCNVAASEPSPPSACRLPSQKKSPTTDASRITCRSCGGRLIDSRGDDRLEVRGQPTTGGGAAL